MVFMGVCPHAPRLEFMWAVPAIFLGDGSYALPLGDAPAAYRHWN